MPEHWDASTIRSIRSSTATKTITGMARRATKSSDTNHPFLTTALLLAIRARTRANKKVKRPGLSLIVIRAASSNINDLRVRFGLMLPDLL